MTAIIIVLIILFYCIYRKYKITKKRLDYEVNDVRNLSTIPKTEAEMREISNKLEKRTYQNLADESAAV